MIVFVSLSDLQFNLFPSNIWTAAGELVQYCFGRLFCPRSHMWKVDGHLPTEIVWIRLLTVFVSSCCCCFMAELSEEVWISCCSISFIMLVCFSTNFFSCSFSSLRSSSSLFLFPSIFSTRFSRTLTGIKTTSFEKHFYRVVLNVCDLNYVEKGLWLEQNFTYLKLKAN